MSLLYDLWIFNGRIPGGTGMGFGYGINDGVKAARNLAHANRWEKTFTAPPSEDAGCTSSAAISRSSTAPQGAISPTRITAPQRAKSVADLLRCYSLTK